MFFTRTDITKVSYFGILLAISFPIEVGASNFWEQFVNEFDCASFVARGSSKWESWLQLSIRRDCDVAKGAVQKDYKNIGYARFRMSEHTKSVGDVFSEERWLYATISISELNPQIFVYRFAAADARILLAERATKSGDYDSAFRLYQNAAQTGHQKAKFRLAQFYIEGRGVRRNYVTAYAWLSLTASYARGAYSSEALQLLDLLESKMTPQLIQDAQKQARDLELQIDEYRRQHSLTLE